MEEFPTKKSDTLLFRTEQILKVVEGGRKLIVTALIAIFAGISCFVKMQMDISGLKEWQVSAATKIEQHSNALERMKGHLGITKTDDARKPQSALVWLPAEICNE